MATKPTHPTDTTRSTLPTAHFPVTPVTVTWSRIQPAEPHARLRAGASLVLDVVKKIHPVVGVAAEGFERFRGTSVLPLRAGAGRLRLALWPQ
ncbi:hypothetical protein ACFVAF_31420 [Streptomyces sp. NPDC057596]|uniref:hypothetical protein n=1 Tax=Streptomyces sp. NPDC057596 TaxID=3346178 RepID=UPI0036BDC738